MNDPYNEKMIQLHQELSRLDIEDWLTYDLFSKEWWIIIFSFFTPWVIFVKLVKRDRLPELVLFNLCILIICETLDHLGYELGLWFYPVEMLPLFPRFEEVNLSALPVTYTLIYQYYSDWKRYSIALVIMSSIFVFLAEPVLIKMNLYQPLHWNPVYGFPVYIAIGLVVKWFVQALYSAALKSGTSNIDN
jgi:hypothetical protein